MKKKHTRNIVISLVILLVLSLIIVGVMHHLEVNRFEEEQHLAEVILTETEWYLDLVENIKTKLPATAGEAPGHVRHALVLAEDDLAYTLSVFMPFYGYEYLEELPLGLHRVHFIGFSGVDLQVALLEWSHGLRTEAPQVFLSELSDGTPALKLSPYDNSYSGMSESELFTRYFYLLGLSYVELEGIT